MKNFLSINDVPDPDSLVEEAWALKGSNGPREHLGNGKTLGLIFMNPSLRTRLSTQQAAFSLGMHVMVVNMDKDSWGLEFEDGTIMDGSTAEHIKEASAVISQYCDVIGIRTFAGLQDRARDYQEDILKKFVTHARVPVISLESATLHPLQSLADMLTIREFRPSHTPKVVLSWAPHPRALPQAVANSFMQWAAKSDFELVVTHPPGYELAEEFTRGVEVVYHQDQALAGADFVYAKNWSSYKEYGKILSQDPGWMITPEKMALTNKGKFMHCLPIRRNVVASDAVVDGSLVIPQAQNRLFAAQAVLSRLLKP